MDDYVLKIMDEIMIHEGVQKIRNSYNKNCEVDFVDPLSILNIDILVEGLKLNVIATANIGLGQI
tara:strand:+ start:460 stop:654 length:195 start_codon:yes stop_codon:yes gene_type:complete